MLAPGRAAFAAAPSKVSGSSANTFASRVKITMPASVASATVAETNPMVPIVPPARTP